MQAGIAEPGTRTRVGAVGVSLPVGRDPFLDVRRVRLVPIPLERPPALLGFLGKRAQHFELGQTAADRELLHQAELRSLLHAVDEVLTVDEDDQHVRLRLLSLDQVRREVSGAERRQRIAEHRTAHALEQLGVRFLQRVAIRVVGRDEIPLAAELLVKRRGEARGQHVGRGADAERGPVALRAGDRIGVTAGDHVEHALFVCDLVHRQRGRRRHGAHQEVDLVLLDQLVRLLGGETGVRGVVLDHQFNLAAVDATLGIDLGKRHQRAALLAFALGGVGAGEGVMHPDLDRRFALGKAQNRRREHGRAGQRHACFHDAAAGHSDFHIVPPIFTV